MTIEEQPQEDYITATQARQMMGISSVTLARMIEQGELTVYPSKRHKQVKLLKVADVQKWIKEAGPVLKRRKRIVRSRKPAPKQMHYGAEDVKKERPAA